MLSRLSVALAGACFCAQVFAGSENTRKVATTELNNIQTQTENLTMSINDWDGTNAETALSVALFNIHSPTLAIVDYVGNATEELRKVPTVWDTTQSFKIGTPTQRLAYAVNISIAALIKKQPEFKNSGAGGIVIEDVQKLLMASKKFSDLLLSYVPENLKPVANALSRQIINSLQQGLDCFSDDEAVSKAACITATPDPNRTFDMAVAYGAIRQDGSPIA